MNKNQTSDKVDKPKTKVWIEDGILCCGFNNELSIDNVLKLEEDSLKVIRDRKLQMVPVIVDLSKIDITNYKAHLSDFGKIFTSHHDLFMHESNIWIVGANSNVLGLAELVSNMFLNGRIKYVDTFAAAKKEAIESIDATESILE
jgi:hypothetical protein